MALVGWIALAAPSSRAAFYIQGLGSAAGLLAMGLTGLWLFPPWWVPWIFAGLLVMAFLVGWRRRYPFALWLPSGGMAWIFTAAFIAVGGWGDFAPRVCNRPTRPLTLFTAYPCMRLAAAW